jgi:hypothetical protein
LAKPLISFATAAQQQQVVHKTTTSEYCYTMDGSPFQRKRKLEAILEDDRDVEAILEAERVDFMLIY